VVQHSTAVYCLLSSVGEFFVIQRRINNYKGHIAACIRTIVNDALENMCKEVVVVCFRHFGNIFRRIIQPENSLLSGRY
jgi:hypothetical protein